MSRPHLKLRSDTPKNLRRAVVETLERRCLITGSPYHDRGWVSIIVDNTLAVELTPKLDRWKQTLVGDGYTIAPDVAGVLSHNSAPRMNDELYVWANLTTPPEAVTLSTQEPGALDQYKLDVQAVKDIVNADALAALAAGSYLSQIVLVGHPTVPYSGAPATLEDAYNQHERSAATSDVYYADFDGTPQSWGDQLTFSISSQTAHYENTTNEMGDGRFDTMFVPGDPTVVTVTGSSGSFQLHYSDVNSEDDKDTHEFDTDTLPAGASGDAVRDALNEQFALLGGGTAFATVIKAGNAYTIRMLDSTSETAGYVKTLNVSGSGLSTSSTTLGIGGAECAIGRIDMANLDSALRGKKCATYRSFAQLPAGPEHRPICNWRGACSRGAARV